MNPSSNLKGALVALKTADCLVRGRVVDVRFTVEDDDTNPQHRRLEDVENFWLDDVEELEEDPDIDEGVRDAVSVEDLVARKGGLVGGGLQQFHAVEIIEFWRLDGISCHRMKCKADEDEIENRVGAFSLEGNNEHQALSNKC